MPLVMLCGEPGNRGAAQRGTAPAARSRGRGPARACPRTGGESAGRWRRKVSEMKVPSGCTALALAIASTVLLAAGVLSAPAHSKVLTRAPRLSRGFDVHNESSFPIRLESVTGDNNFEGRTPDGSILEPHKCCHHFEVQQRLNSTQRDTAHYAILTRDDGRQIGTFEVHMVVEALSSWGATCTTSYGTCAVYDRQTKIRLDDGPDRAVFHITNASTHPIRLESVTGDTGGGERPADGSVLGPRKCCDRFDIIPDKNGRTQLVTARYAILGDDGQQIGRFEAYMDVEAGTPGPTKLASCNTSYGTCTVRETNTDIRLDDPAR